MVSVVGLGDETLQWILAIRHFGILDLLTNTTAGLLTLVSSSSSLARRITPTREQRRSAGVS